MLFLAAYLNLIDISKEITDAFAQPCLCRCDFGAHRAAGSQRAYAARVFDPDSQCHGRSADKVELRFNEAVIGATARAEIAMTGMPGMANHAPMPITGFTARLGNDRKSMTLLLRRPLPAGLTA